MLKLEFLALEEFSGDLEIAGWGISQHLNLGAVDHSAGQAPLNSSLTHPNTSAGSGIFNPQIPQY